MVDAGTTRDESRFQALAELGLLDGAPDGEIDEIVELAAAICGTPIGFFSLIDSQHQWLKSIVGFQLREMPREVSFCTYTIRQREMLVVEDASADPRFANNVLVTENPRIRFYAGMPVLTSAGDALGALCVVDRKPRTLTKEQRKALEVLSRQVWARIDLRMQHAALAKSLRQQEALAAGLRSSEALFRTFMNNSPFASYVKDADGRMVFYNREFAARFELTMDEGLGKLDHELWPSEQAGIFRKHDLEVLARDVRTTYVEEASGPGGKLRSYRSFKFPYEGIDGKKLIAGISVDITDEIARDVQFARSQVQLEVANIQLLQLSVTDALTGLRNRRAFDERLAIECSMARRRRRDLSAIIIDIDNFKQINDRLGHLAGDDVLRKLSEVLLATVRLTDLAARYGGEEFAILLPETDVVHAVQWAERFREALRETSFPHGPITVSMGVAGLEDETGEGDMVKRADEALYAAKRGGKDAVVSYGAGLRGQRIAQN